MNYPPDRAPSELRYSVTAVCEYIVRSMTGLTSCAVCGGTLERSEQYPEAGYLHRNDADDTHKPVSS